MLLHETVIDKLIRLCDNYGGHREQTKLKEEFRRLTFAEYTQASGTKVLVLDEELKKALKEFDRS
jgi:predicted transcriptional regulator